MSNWKLRVAMGILVTMIAALTFLSLGGLAGDAVIHLIFAENALAGHWFEFNTGLPSGGESSPLYLLYLVGLYKVFGAFAIPYVIQFMGLSMWVALLYGFWRLLRLLGAEDGWALMLLAMVGLMPGSARNAVMGMENVYFAAGLIWWLGFMVKQRWFEQVLNWRVEIVYGVIGGLLSCLRPEGVVVVAVLMTSRVFMMKNLGPLKPLLARYVIVCIVSVLLFAVQTLWYYKLTKNLPFTGGLARHLLSSMQDKELFGLRLNVKILVRWAAYAPLALLSIMGVQGLWKRSLIETTEKQELGIYRFAWALIVLVVVFTILFMTLFSSEHLARYTIFYWPLVIVVGWIGAEPKIRQLWEQGGGQRILLVVPIVFLMTVYLAEAVTRVVTLGPGEKLMDLALAPAQRKVATDKLLADLGFKDNRSHDKLAVLGMVEVQSRYLWDDRIIVESLDGIVDGRLLPFVKNGYYDHLAFAKKVGITHFIELPNFNRNSSFFSLKDLGRMKSGEVLKKDGLELLKLPNGAVHICY